MGRSQIKKVCSRCGEVWPLTAFYRHRAHTDGRASICKACRKHPEAREKEAAYKRQLRKSLRDEGLQHYGARCACCGETAVEFLTIDHIHGRGGEEETFNGAAEWARLKRLGWPRDNIQILCYNCNCAKGIYGYCPVHQKQEKE